MSTTAVGVMFEFFSYFTFFKSYTATEYVNNGYPRFRNTNKVGFLVYAKSYPVTLIHFAF